MSNITRIIAKVLVIPAVIAAFLGTQILTEIVVSSLFGISIYSTEDEPWIFPLVFILAGYVAYVVGNLMEGDRLSDIIEETIGSVFIVLSVALVAALVAIGIFFYKNMPPWAFVISTLLVLIAVLLLVLIRTIAREKT